MCGQIKGKTGLYGNSPVGVTMSETWWLSLVTRCSQHSVRFKRVNREENLAYGKCFIIMYNRNNQCSISCQLVRQKISPIFHQLKYLIVHSSLNTMSSQHRTHIISTKQTHDVIIKATNILCEINYQKPHHSSDPHRL